MKLSCLPVSLFSEFTSGGLDIASWAGAARAIGFDGFDISSMFVKNHTPTYLAKTREEIEAAGIPLVMLSGYPDFTHPSPEQREREMVYLNCDMAVADELGAKYLRVLAGQAHPGLAREDGVKLAVDGLTRAAAAAEKYNVDLVYENHAKPGAWHYIDFSFPPDIFLDVFRGIRSTSIGLNFDIGNSTAEAAEAGDEVRLLAKVMDKVKTMHICDMLERGRFSPTLVGTGVTPVLDLLRFVREHGFDGWLCIEEAGGLGMDGVRKAHDYVREMWEKAGK